MRSLRTYTFYVIVIAFFSGLIYWITIQGGQLELNRPIVVKPPAENGPGSFIDSMIHNITHPLAILLAQIVAVILVARIFGWICKKIGQPTVIGEIIAGIVLGPSLLGLYFPDFSGMLFPVQSLPNLQFLSQIGLIMFMFVVGMELDLAVLRNKAHEAVVISHASIIIPFALGMGLSYFIFEQFAPAGIQFLPFGLFMGISMSITAFPVLARIVQERGIHKSKLGALVITCAAADDVTAWCILAVVIAIVKAGVLADSLYVILLAVAYVVIMVKIVKPFLKRVGDLHSSPENLSKPIVGIFFVTLIISAYATEIIGIHALFGAFMAGAIMPENTKFRNLFIEKIEDVSLVLLLPLFFVFTGLRTQIGLLNDPGLWKLCGYIILVAVIGKFAGSALAAKYVGQSWKDSLAIGALMNTRGLMELVVLNIGYDLGVLTPEIFAMMVIMALVTTVMTGPALDLINWLFRKTADVSSQIIEEIPKYKVLVSFANPESGKILLRVANALISKLNGNASLTVLHLSPANELHHFNIDEYEKESFEAVIGESVKLKQKVTTLFKASNDIEDDIAEVANKGDFDLLLVGVGQSIFEGSLLGKVLGFTARFINPEKLLNTVTGRERLFESLPFDERTRLILSKSDVPVGVLIHKNLSVVGTVFISILNDEDLFLLDYAQKLIQNAGAQVRILYAADSSLQERILALAQNFPNNITLQQGTPIDPALLKQYDLMLISIATWKKLITTKTLLIDGIPSTLIIDNKQQLITKTS